MRTRSITRLRLVLSLACLISCLVLVHEATTPRLLQNLELLTYDWRMTLLSDQESIDERIVIVDIDERSLAREGQWPWPRSRIAELIQILKSDYQASAIGLDILFPEASRAAEEDRTLQQAIHDNQAILAQLFQLENGSRQLSVGRISSPLPLDNSLPLPPAQGYIANTATISSQNPAGHIAIDIDEDGKIRRLPPLTAWDEQQFASLPLMMLRQLFALEALTVSRPSGVLAPAARVTAAPFSIPVDQQGRMLIPYQGKAGHYLYIPAIDVLNRQVEPGYLQDRLVLIGSSATGLYDLIATPWSKNYPGVEVHANVLSALLDNSLLIQPAQGHLLIGLLCILFCAIVLLSYQHLGTLMSLTVPALLAIAWISFNVTSWAGWHIVLPLTPPLLLLVLLVLVNSPAMALQANRQRQQIYRHFQDYVPRAVVEKLAQQHDYGHIQPERRDMTVLFMDIRGFTSIAEQLPPGELADMINQVLSPVTRIIHEQGGTIDKYMGDAVMAFWGAPVAQSDHAQRAVQAALQILEAIEQLNTDLHSRNFPKIRVGIGINSGHMTVGNMGSDFRLSYTVIGDAVNIASRLEGLTKEYDTDLLIGQATAEQLDDTVPCTNLGQSMIKGRKNLIRIYTPVAAESARTANASQPTESSLPARN